MNFEKMRDFVMRATFTGPTPGIVREISTENAMKLFQYNLPALIVFRNATSIENQDFHKIDEEVSKLIATDIPDKILLLLGNI